MKYRNQVLVPILSLLCCNVVLGQPPSDHQPADKNNPEDLARFLEQVYADSIPPEGAKMLLSIVQGSQMGPGEGWFGPAQSKYNFEWLSQTCGQQVVNDVTKEHFDGPEDLFRVLDRNRDGRIQPMDLDWSPSNPMVEQAYQLNRIFRRIDSKGEGAITREQWNALFEKAADGEEVLTAENFTGTLLAGFTGAFTPGDRPTPEQLIRGFFAGEIGSPLEGPQIGQQAPWFKLRRVQGEGAIELSSLIGEKPVVLVFGNFTCGPFRSFYPAVDRLYEKYKDRANFLMIYVREAHPSDGWKMESNTKVGVDVAQPSTFEERSNVAKQFCSRLSPNIPVVVDELSDPVGHAYSGMPARLYVIDKEGKVVFKSGRGPFGFSPPEMEQSLAMCLLEGEATKGAEPSTLSSNSLEPMSIEETWSRLPKCIQGGGGPLPLWARVMAKQLPRTTAAMLQLDYAHRTRSPLDQRLRAKMRWIIAHANHCNYSKAIAESDLRASGGTEEDLQRLATGSASWLEEEKDALQFAHELTIRAHLIPDSLFETLRLRYGDAQVASMVLLGAYGNFQDRILLGLSTVIDQAEPLEPLDIRFATDAFQTQPTFPPNKPLPQPISDGMDVVNDDEDWDSLSYGQLEARMASQKQREQRLPTPTWEEVAKKLPPEFKAKPTRIVWNLVCMGNVPELAVPWSMTTRTMWAECPQDRVFEESLFWVQTRAIQCNYCMGHCEMLLEVAGMSPQQIRERLTKLSSNDWSSFPTTEQRSYQFARKLTMTPWLLKSEDYIKLERDLGAKEAMATFFWLCRGLYMTRVSDGFQLQLESDNVFMDFAAQAQSIDKVDKQ
jgi:alkylhydroperoxidase family enzyme/alkyl hydroperoxide reductase subunit AhpC